MWEYNTSNPFDFMDMISLQGKTNFFEKVAEYQNQVWWTRGWCKKISMLILRVLFYSPIGF
jgi:ribonucleoside-diphosphate reductase beta chain